MDDFLGLAGGAVEGVEVVGVGRAGCGVIEAGAGGEAGKAVGKMVGEAVGKMGGEAVVEAGAAGGRRAEFAEKLRFLFEPWRYKVLYGGRGSGKSWGVARALLLLGAERPLRVLCARAVQRSIRQSVHRLLADQVGALGLGGVYEVFESVIRGRNGTEFVFAGLSSVTADSIKSFEGVDVVWVEEAQTVDGRSWEVLIPTIRKAGSEIWVTFNPDLDTDATFERFVRSPLPNGRAVLLNYWDNPWFPAELEAERRHAELTMPADVYGNVWEGVCRRAVAGAIYGVEVAAAREQGRVRAVPCDGALPVHCVWDLGWNDQMTVIMVQRAGSELRVVDYLEDSHRTLDWFVLRLRERGYVFGTDWIPHDGLHRSFLTGRSTREVLEGLGRRVEVVPMLPVEEGIRAARMVFGRVFFDEGRTGRLLECLRRYRRVVDERTGEPGRPVHDGFSHGADAFRYMAVVADRLQGGDGLCHPVLRGQHLGRVPASWVGY